MRRLPPKTAQNCQEAVGVRVWRRNGQRQIGRVLRIDFEICKDWNGAVVPKSPTKLSFHFISGVTREDASSVE